MKVAPKLCCKCDGPITTPLLVGQEELCVFCADFDPDDPDAGELDDPYMMDPSDPDDALMLAMSGLGPLAKE